MVYREKPENFNQKMEVVSCFLEHRGQFLILHRQDHKSEGNKWGVPAGKVEKGEELRQALLRELKEELGVNFGAQFKYWGKVYERYPAFDFLYHMFSLTLDMKPEISLNLEEHKDFTWVTPENSLKMDLLRDEDACIKLFYGLP